MGISVWGSKEFKKWSLIKWWKAPATVRFDARPVLHDSDRNWVPDAPNVRSVALNGDSLGHIQKLPKSEDPYGSRFRYHLMKKHFWASGMAKCVSIIENNRLWPFTLAQWKKKFLTIDFQFNRWNIYRISQSSQSFEHGAAILNLFWRRIFEYPCHRFLSVNPPISKFVKE